MYQVIVVVHVLLGLSIIGLILMQQGKGADAGAAFGSGGSSGSVFGAQGAASFLSRTTAIFATLFFTTSLTLAVLGGQQNKPTDLMENVEVEQKVADVPLAAPEAVPFAIPMTNTPTVEDKKEVPTSAVTVPATDNDKNAAKANEDKAMAAGAAKPEKTSSTEKEDTGKNKAADDKLEKKPETDNSKAADKSDKNHETDKKKSTGKSDKKHESEKKKAADKTKKKNESDKTDKK